MKGISRKGQRGNEGSAWREEKTTETREAHGEKGSSRSEGRLPAKIFNLEISLQEKSENSTERHFFFSIKLRFLFLCGVKAMQSSNHAIEMLRNDRTLMNQEKTAIDLIA